MKWALLVTAPDQLTAEMWRDALLEEGIPALIEPRDAVAFLGVSSFPCRVMVPTGMVQEAKAILSRHQETTLP